jgi:hypothetical protein
VYFVPTVTRSCRCLVRFSCAASPCQRRVYESLAPREPGPHHQLIAGLSLPHIWDITIADLVVISLFGHLYALGLVLVVVAQV